MENRQSPRTSGSTMLRLLNTNERKYILFISRIKMFEDDHRAN